MLNEYERIAHRLVSLGREKAVETLRAYAGILRDADKTMEAYGWIRVDAPLDALMYEGQPVQWVGRKAFILPPEEFERRRVAALEDAKRRDEAAKPKVTAKPGESLASVLCPACQSIMAKSPVCPNCTKGKAGYKILCICTECSHEVYL